MQTLIGESRTNLWTEGDSSERILVAGKIHNLRLAVSRLDGLVIHGGGIFSFWKHVGRTSRLRGYVPGRELREGCVIPNIGGGLCQLSNSLYDAALKAGFEIVERHAHTRVIAGSLAERGRDATVFWNYVDLRFRSQNGFRIEAKLDDRELVVRFYGAKDGQIANRKEAFLPQLRDREQVGSCMTCEVSDCHRVVERPREVEFGRTAFLVDEFWPEFDLYIKGQRTRQDPLFLPIDGHRFRRANYAWSTDGFAKAKQSFYVTAVRSYTSRKLAAQGAARQLNLLNNYERLTESYARRLTFDVLHLVIQQDLLPFLWRGGYLGGRTYDVLMTALPMAEIEKRLDVGRSKNPRSTTFGDFRADMRLIEAEREALQNARKLITPHTGIADLFGQRATLLDWHQPKSPVKKKEVRNKKPVVVFPASTVGRKGCYELREALRGLDVRVIRLGADIEKPDFWQGFDTARGERSAIESADVVVLPAYIEHRPRTLLLAAALGVPVIASSACGLGGANGVKSLENIEPDRLRKAIVSAIFSGKG